MYQQNVKTIDVLLNQILDVATSVKDFIDVSLHSFNRCTKVCIEVGMVVMNIYFKLSIENFM